MKQLTDISKACGEHVVQVGEGAEIGGRDCDDRCAGSGTLDEESFQKLGGYVPIHHWHVDVHEDQLIRFLLQSVSILHSLDGLISALRLLRRNIDRLQVGLEDASTGGLIINDEGESGWGNAARWFPSKRERFLGLSTGGKHLDVLDAAVSRNLNRNIAHTPCGKRLPNHVLHRESKGGSGADVGLAADVASKGLSKSFAQGEAEAHALGIEPIGVGDSGVGFKELGLPFSENATALIDDSGFQELVFCPIHNLNGDLCAVGVFDRVL